MLHLFAGCLNRTAPYFAQANGVGLSVYRLDEETLAAELLESFLRALFEKVKYKETRR